MKAFYGFADYVLKRGGRAHIFCSAVQIASRWLRYRARTEEVEDDVVEMDVFNLKLTAFFNSPKHSNFLQVPRLKRPWHPSEVEQAIYFWGKILPFNSMLARICYDVPCDIKSKSSGWTNQMFTVPRLPIDERVIRTGSSASGSRDLLLPEQKSSFV